MPTFQLPIRIYYEDTDAAGVVYYANYLRFAERARTEWLRSAGYELLQLSQEQGIVFVVRRVLIDYLRPGRLGDLLLVTAELVELSNSRLKLHQQVHRDTETLATMEIDLVCLAAATFRPTAIPQPLYCDMEALLERNY